MFAGYCQSQRVGSQEEHSPNKPPATWLGASLKIRPVDPGRWLPPNLNSARSRALPQQDVPSGGRHCLFVLRKEKQLNMSATCKPTKPNQTPLQDISTPDPQLFRSIRGSLRFERARRTVFEERGVWAQLRASQEAEALLTEEIGLSGHWLKICFCLVCLNTCFFYNMFVLKGVYLWFFFQVGFGKWRQLGPFGQVQRMRVK